MEPRTVTVSMKVGIIFDNRDLFRGRADEIELHEGPE